MTFRDGEIPNGKHILDVTCGSRSIWFNKHHPQAIYMDKRREYEERRFGRYQYLHHLDVDPDVIGDFTSIPFPDESFELVVFDPPHTTEFGEGSWLYKKYGKLEDGWQDMLRDGYRECMRVLKPFGVLVFKWSSVEFSVKEICAVMGAEPLFGHKSGKKSTTHWLCFMKTEGGNPYDNP